MSHQYEYEMLKASNSIEINLPVAKVWEFLTKPDFKYTWVATSPEEENFLISSWKNGEVIAWRYFDKETQETKDYYRGSITSVQPHKKITFEIHDKMEEDSAKQYEDEQQDINEETWEIIFEEAGEKTKLTITKADYDSDHITDDEHDHEKALKTCKEVAGKYIPSELQKIKELCEAAQ